MRKRNGRVVDVSRSMRPQHPFDIWRALMALRYQALNAGIMGDDGESPFYTPHDVACVLYTNYELLTPDEQHRVIRLKLKDGLILLKHTCFGQEAMEFRWKKCRYTGHDELETIYLGTYRARSGPFTCLSSRDQFIESSRWSIDQDWRNLRKSSSGSRIMEAHYEILRSRMSS